MLRLMRASGDVVAGNVGQVLVPGEVLSAVDAAPVPVSAHHSVNEVAVIGLRRVILVEITALDIVFVVSADGSSSEQSREEDEDSEELHVVDAAHRC
jgi:hypothetical protein